MKNSIKAKVPPHLNLEASYLWSSISPHVFGAFIGVLVALSVFSLASILNMPKHKYVVADWGSWGIDVQSSSKIIVPDPFNVSEGNDCSLQGTDPATKRPMLFHGHVLAVFGEFMHPESQFFSLHQFHVL